MEADIRDVRIERYFPDVLSSADDFKALAATVDPELIDVWKALWKQMLNTFVYDLDTDGAARWESMLKLYPASTDSLDSRRQAILVKINSTLPYTFRSFQAMLDGVYGQGMITEAVDYGKRHLQLDVVTSLLHQSAAIKRLAHVIVPANLTIGISNTKSGQLNLYGAIILRQCRHTIIRPASNFSIANNATVKPYRGGAVYWLKKQTIRSGN